MNKKLIFSLLTLFFGLVLSLSFVSSALMYVYQEDANQSIKDASSLYQYVNYTKVTNMTGALWQIYYANATLDFYSPMYILKNITIPQSCIDNVDVLPLRFYFGIINASFVELEMECLISGSYQSIFNDLYDLSGEFVSFEGEFSRVDEMFDGIWEMGDPHTNMNGWNYAVDHGAFSSYQTYMYLEKPPYMVNLGFCEEAIIFEVNYTVGEGDIFVELLNPTALEVITSLPYSLKCRATPINLDNLTNATFYIFDYNDTIVYEQTQNISGNEIINISQSFNGLPDGDYTMDVLVCGENLEGVWCNSGDEAPRYFSINTTAMPVVEGVDQNDIVDTLTYTGIGAGVLIESITPSIIKFFIVIVILTAFSLLIYFFIHEFLLKRLGGG